MNTNDCDCYDPIAIGWYPRCDDCLKKACYCPPKPTNGSWYPRCTPCLTKATPEENWKHSQKLGPSTYKIPTIYESWRINNSWNKLKSAKHKD